jgi:acetyl esterase/lipase
MQSVPLYGQAPIPNSKPGPDEETSPDGKWIRKVSRPVIQVYLPARAKATGASVVIFPGGSYAGLSFEYEGTQQANFFIDHGIAAFVVKYRIPSDATMVDKSMGPLQDAQQAMRFARQHATDWNLDPQRIGAIGFSAGGHLASTAGTHFDRPVIENRKHMDLRPDFMVLLYPVISFSDSLMHKGSRDNLVGKTPSAEKINYYSNELQVTARTPPAFLVHAKDDGTVKVQNSINFYDALLKNKVPAEIHLFEKGGHGLFIEEMDKFNSELEKFARK